jgi:hypothetical protein
MRARLAAGLVVMDLAVLLVAMWFDPAPNYGADLLIGLGVAAYLGIGLLLVRRVPTNPIGALMLATGTLAVAPVALGVCANLGAQQIPPWPGVAKARLIADAMFIYPVLIALVGIPLVFPDGRLPSRRFRAVVLLTVAGAAGWMFGSVFDTPADLIVAVSVPVAFGGAVTAVILRFRRGDSVQRQQIKWLAAVVIVGAMSELAGLMLFGLNADLGSALVIIGLFALYALPFVIGIAILRYRLYDIDRIISRTLAYVLITAVLVGAYAALVVLLGGPLAGATGGDTISVALSTLVVAALFQPLRHRVQSIVDRRFDRARYDGQRLVDAFAGRLRDEVDIATVTADLDATVRTAVRPATAALWVRGRPG